MLVPIKEQRASRLSPAKKNKVAGGTDVLSSFQTCATSSHPPKKLWLTSHASSQLRNISFVISHKKGLPYTKPEVLVQGRGCSGESAPIKEHLLPRTLFTRLKSPLNKARITSEYIITTVFCQDRK